MTEASAKDYWESLHRRSYGLQSVGYVGVGTPFNAWMYRLRRRVFRQAVHQFLRPRDDLEILDVGSGTGFYLDRWHELGFRNVHASDVSEVAVERLRERYPSCEVAQLDIGTSRPARCSADSTSSRSSTSYSTSPATAGTSGPSRTLPDW
jgi:SAM-dependent methyltransferase